MAGKDGPIPLCLLIAHMLKNKVFTDNPLLNLGIRLGCHVEGVAVNAAGKSGVGLPCSEG